VLDGHPAPPSPKGVRAPPPKKFSPCSLWPNSWMDQDSTSHGGRPQPRGLCIRWGPRPLPKKVTEPSKISARVYCGKRCMDQDGTWHGGRLQPMRLCARWGRSPPPKNEAKPPLQFSAHFYCGQTAGCIKMPLGTEIGLSPGEFVFDGDPVPSPKRGPSPLPNFWPMSVVAKRLDGSRQHLAWRWALVQATFCYMGTQLHVAHCGLDQGPPPCQVLS